MDRKTPGPFDTHAAERYGPKTGEKSGKKAITFAIPNTLGTTGTTVGRGSSTESHYPNGDDSSESDYAVVRPP